MSNSSRREAAVAAATLPLAAPLNFTNLQVSTLCQFHPSEYLQLSASLGVISICDLLSKVSITDSVSVTILVTV